MLVDSLQDDTPFGIRALLDDPEVDGVWNSHEVTAMHLHGAAQTLSASQLRNIPTNQPPDSFTSTYDTADTGLTSPTGTLSGHL